MPEDVNATQVGGDHYKTTFQHWDFTIEVLRNRYLEGCATKYPSRWRKKNGLQDLMKSVHYVDKIISKFESGQMESMMSLHARYWPAHSKANIRDIVTAEVMRFSVANDLSAMETAFMILMATWHNMATLNWAKETLLLVIEQAKGELGLS